MIEVDLFRDSALEQHYRPLVPVEFLHLSKYLYEHKHTGSVLSIVIYYFVHVIHQFDLVCDRKFLVEFGSTAYMIGSLISSVISGIAADR